MRQSAAERLGGFYTQGEFDLAPMLARHPGSRFLELGRSCVLKPYRTKRTVELLWSGIWAYLQHHRIDAMFGCASFDGTDPDALALPLSFLHHQARSQGAWARDRACRALRRHGPPAGDGRRQARAQAVAAADQGLSAARRPLRHRRGHRPPVRHTDVLVVLPVAAIDKRYADYYGGEAPATPPDDSPAAARARRPRDRSGSGRRPNSRFTSAFETRLLSP
jgi:putative hemolysin